MLMLILSRSGEVTLLRSSALQAAGKAQSSLSSKGFTILAAGPLSSTRQRDSLTSIPCCTANRLPSYNRSPHSSPDQSERTSHMACRISIAQTRRQTKRLKKRAEQPMLGTLYRPCQKASIRRVAQAVASSRAVNANASLSPVH